MNSFEGKRRELNDSVRDEYLSPNNAILYEENELEAGGVDGKFDCLADGEASH